MKITNYKSKGGCGGKGTLVEIQLNDKCNTERKEFPVGTTVTWTEGDGLGDCATNNYFSIQDPMEFKIVRQDKSRQYCIDEVTVVLDDPKSTTYHKNTDDKWRSNDDKIDIFKQN